MILHGDCIEVMEGFDFIGIEQSEEYCAIARARIAYWQREKAREPLQLDLEAEAV